MAHHHHHGHGHGHDHDHDHADAGAHRAFWFSRRLIVAAIVVAALLVSACLVQVSPGEAVVITRFGDPVRVITSPGLALKLPAPIDDAVPVDLRVRTTSSGLYDVGTKDGLRVLVQAYIAWHVPDDPDHVRQFLRAVRNEPALAAAQLRSFTGSALEITASGFALSDLVNTDPGKIRLDQFEAALRQRIDARALRVYGITISQVGLERLTLPNETLTATIGRMRAERETVASERSAEGSRAAARIQADADRDARVETARANADVANIEARARLEAADIYRKAYASDPALYIMLRSLDTLANVVGPNINLILRSDAAPFRALVDGPTETVPTGTGHASGGHGGPTPAPAPEAMGK
jgi:modulator of FtsH protease HflC